MRILGTLVLMAALAVPQGLAAKKKKKSGEDVTQVRQLPKEPPLAVTAETRRLVFHVSPLSAKGLLSRQVRDALKALERVSGGATLVKLRAFVAGSGDLRRVQAIVSETFTERRWPLPALSVVQVGGLPLEGAQVVLESTAMTRKEVNPNGLIFFSGQQAVSPQPFDPVVPLVEKSLANLRTAVAATGAEPQDVLRGTCFLSTLDGIQKVREMASSQFPAAAWDYVQAQRAPTRAVAECEAVARARTPVQGPLVLLNPEGLARSPNYSQVARVGAPRLALSGAQVAFGSDETDIRLAFSRLEKELAQVGTSLKHTAASSTYPLSDSIALGVRKVRFEFFDAARPPASTMLPFEGLPSMDARFGVDVAAVIP